MQGIFNINIKDILEYFDKYESYIIFAALILWRLFVGPLIRKLGKRYQWFGVSRIGLFALLGLLLSFYSPSVGVIFMTALLLLSFYLGVKGQSESEHLEENPIEKDTPIMELIDPDEDKSTSLLAVVIFAVLSVIMVTVTLVIIGTVFVQMLHELKSKPSTDNYFQLGFFALIFYLALKMNVGLVKAIYSMRKNLSEKSAES